MVNCNYCGHYCIGEEGGRGGEGRERGERERGGEGRERGRVRGEEEIYIEEKIYIIDN